MTRLIRQIGQALMLSLALVLLTGCPTNSSEGGPVDDCDSIGQQCKLGKGKLGVCTMNPDGDMRCEPQH